MRRVAGAEPDGSSGSGDMLAAWAAPMWRRHGWPGWPVRGHQVSWSPLTSADVRSKAAIFTSPGEGGTILANTCRRVEPTPGAPQGS